MALSPPPGPVPLVAIARTLTQKLMQSLKALPDLRPRRRFLMLSVAKNNQTIIVYDCQEQTARSRSCEELLSFSLEAVRVQVESPNDAQYV